jgi:hypothetical protein
MFPISFSYSFANQVASHPLELERELNKSVKGNSFYNSKLLMNPVTLKVLHRLAVLLANHITNSIASLPYSLLKELTNKEAVFFCLYATGLLEIYFSVS